MLPNHIYCMDAFKGLGKLGVNSVDLIVADPPYNLAAKDKITVKKNTVISTLEAWGAWDVFHPFDYDVFILSLIKECHRVLKPGGALYLFLAKEQHGYFIRKAIAKGFVYRHLLVVVKKNPPPSYNKANWRNSTEMCSYFTKGKPATYNYFSHKESFAFFEHVLGKKYTAHPTEKPLRFIERLVLASSKPGELVLDPFMGSGTTAVAAAKHGRNYLGFENNPDYVDMARKRIKSITWQKNEEQSS